MGRTPYTSSTVTHLAHQAGSGSDIYNASSSTAEGSSINKTPLSLNLPTGSSSRVKDAPTVWANKAFDPDDDALPAIEERFLDPYETVLYNAGVRQRGENDVDLDYATDDDEEDEDEDEQDDEDDVDDFEEQYQPEDHDPEHYFQPRDLGPQPPQTYEDDFVNGEEDTNSSTIVELAHAFLSRPPRYQESGGEGLSSSEYDDDNQDEDEEPPHGNQGYYDYSYGRGSNQQVVEAPPLGGVEGGFSPSTGVFHTHTLPFNLPNMGERQLQRRASNNITSSLGISASNDAFLA